ncbi:hypothetical protein CH380_15075 [Leptospira adleri]|uniref:Uncharacterized protein n=1 Tax=Leptospira adleri TaxID=2023186 RepID=A0A2M9YLQ6_9LEPT|nr:hypothetical protein CH380_15075 [Leptospira adleri]PJZ63654.1 hypothetical protein CH376_02090 [Leptospira adleri]
MLRIYFRERRELFCFEENKTEKARTKEGISAAIAIAFEKENSKEYKKEIREIEEIRKEILKTSEKKIQF